MKTKHTPGPWFLYWDMGRPHGIGIYRGTDACDAMELVVRFDPEAPPSHADASLIAAAPEMLKALKKAHKRLNAIYLREHWAGKDEHLNPLKAIVAKAEGGES